MSSDQKPLAAFILSLLSGVFIILGGSVWCLWLDGHWDVGWMEGMMHGWEEHTHSWGFDACMPTSAVGSIDNRFFCDKCTSCMGDMGIGLILGIIGGVLALLWKPSGVTVKVER